MDARGKNPTQQNKSNMVLVSKYTWQTWQSSLVLMFSHCNNTVEGSPESLCPYSMRKPSKFSFSWTSFFTKKLQEGVHESPDAPFLPPLPHPHATALSLDVPNEAGIASPMFEGPTGNELMLWPGQVTQELVQSRVQTSEDADGHLQLGVQHLQNPPAKGLRSQDELMILYIWPLDFLPQYITCPAGKQEYLTSVGQ